MLKGVVKLLRSLENVRIDEDVVKNLMQNANKMTQQEVFTEIAKASNPKAKKVGQTLQNMEIGGIRSRAGKAVYNSLTPTEKNRLLKGETLANMVSKKYAKMYDQVVARWNRMQRDIKRHSQGTLQINYSVWAMDPLQFNELKVESQYKAYLELKKEYDQYLKTKAARAKAFQEFGGFLEHRSPKGGIKYYIQDYSKEDGKSILDDTASSLGLSKRTINKMKKQIDADFITEATYREFKPSKGKYKKPKRVNAKEIVKRFVKKAISRKKLNREVQESRIYVESRSSKYNNVKGLSGIQRQFRKLKNKKKSKGGE